MEGGLKLKKIESKNVYQERINNEYLRKNISTQAFIQETIQSKMKNTTNIKCNICGSDNIWVESKQVRAADEATTKFYECLNCGNKWRVD